MKVIDLLNKIANGEEVPKKIKLFSFTYKYGYDDVREENTYLNEVTNERLDNDIFLLTLLNDEIEIIEDTPKEDKKIEQLKFTNGGLTLHKVVDEIENDYPVGEVERTIIFKLNEIIDKVNGE